MICKKCGTVVLPGQYRVNEDGTFICAVCEAVLYRAALEKIEEHFKSFGPDDHPYLQNFILEIIRETIDDVEGKVKCVDSLLSTEQLARLKPLKDAALEEISEGLEGIDK